MKNKLAILIALLGLILALTGCNTIEKTEQPDYSGFVTLNNDNKIGQSIVSRYDGLGGIVLTLAPDSTGEGMVILRLKRDPADQQFLRSATIPLKDITLSGEYLFSFQPLANSELESYYFYLDLKGTGSIKLAQGNASAYLNGSIYQNHQPADGQLAFKLSYNTRMALQGVLDQFIEWGYLLAISLLITTIPGWAFLSYLYPDWEKLGGPTRFTLSVGLSLCIYPLLMLWANQSGLKLGKWLVWIPVLVSGAAILYRFVRYPKKPGKIKDRATKIDLAELSLWIVLLAILATRIWTIRSLAAPLWGDSYQHSLITRLIMENQGLFKNWSPYSELLTFTYHFGFHSFAAAFNWIANLPIDKAILWVGQYLNVLACASLYPLALRVAKSHWAGVFAVLLAGLIFPMPMFYTNWGRYTQLSGQIILIVLIYLLWDTLEKSQVNRKFFLLGIIGLAGLALTHYRVLIFAIIFVLAYFFIYFRAIRWRIIIPRLLILSFGAGLLVLPWFINVFDGKLDLIFRNQITTPASQLSSSTLQTNAIGDLFTYLPAWAWLVTPIIIGWGLWKNKHEIGLISLWWYLILLAANPNWLKLPGTGIIPSFAVFIAAYIPISILIASGLNWLLGWLAKYINWSHKVTLFNKPIGIPIFSIALITLIILASIMGARKRLTDIMPGQFALLTFPDQKAMEWINQNLPSEAGFLVNSFFAYSDSLIVGSDGGWWIPLLTQRSSSLPPLNYGAERGPSEDYRKWINQLTTDINNYGINHPNVVEELLKRKITHIYIGQQQGRVNSFAPLLKPEELLKNPVFRPIYHQDRVWIFEISPKD